MIKVGLKLQNMYQKQSGTAIEMQCSYRDLRRWDERCGLLYCESYVRDIRRHQHQTSSRSVSSVVFYCVKCCADRSATCHWHVTRTLLAQDWNTVNPPGIHFNYELIITRKTRNESMIKKIIHKVLALQLLTTQHLLSSRRRYYSWQLAQLYAMRKRQKTDAYTPQHTYMYVLC